MNNRLAHTSLILLVSTCLTACTAVNNQIADMQIQQKHLADGTSVKIAQNLPPTPNWQCQSVGTPQSYNWLQIQNQGAFNWKGGDIGLLTSKALNYANQESLNINYINLQIPTQKDFTTGGTRLTYATVLNPNAQAVASYYQCQYINPDHKIGWIKTQGAAAIIS